METKTHGEGYVKMIADSIRPDCSAINGVIEVPGRIQTVELKYPRWIHSELMTHRMFARNAASSRAVSVKKSLLNNTFRPIDIPSEQKGMNGGDALSEADKAIVYRDMDELCDIVTKYAEEWAEKGVHKSIINRYLEPFAYITVVVTSCHWNNFFELRANELAEPHFRLMARTLKELMLNSIPVKTDHHLPYYTTDYYIKSPIDMMRVSASRCAAISYLRPDAGIPKELAIASQLVSNKHSSPLEHPNTCYDFTRSMLVNIGHRSGPMKGWITLREIEQQLC